jgi:hypothetical protein
VTLSRLAPLLALACLLSACLEAGAPQPLRPALPGHASGWVFLDEDGNGRRDVGEPGIEDVAVSNGRDITRSDRDGFYQLPVSDDSILFVVQPRGHRVPVDGNGLPRFYYIHKPAGSPRNLRFPGVAPTGPLPRQIDFALQKSPIGDRFQVLLLGDPQTRTLEDVEYFARDIVADLVGTPAAFAIALGDLVYDDLSLFEPMVRTLGRVGTPWWPVIGNHDINFLARDDTHSDESFERLFGPTSYAFQVGRVHFVVLDSDVYQGWIQADDMPGGYAEAFGDDELVFLERYLALVPQDDLVVVTVHVPLATPEGRRSAGSERLLSLLSGHPHTLSISAHAHRQFQLFLGSDYGFDGDEPHHHLNVGATSGSWWLGRNDEVGIPHATMRDGTPNGYWVAHFDAAAYRLEFRAARRPASHQMNIVAPHRVAAGRTGEVEVVANVFAGSTRTQVEMQVGDSGWLPMRHTRRRDPRYVELLARERRAPPDQRRPLKGPGISTHIWVATLPPNLAAGSHLVTIRATDPYAGVLTGRLIVDVVEP